MSSTNKCRSQSSCKNNNETTSTNILMSNNTLEIDTLSNMIELSKQCNKFLDSLQQSRKQLLQDIKNNENDFFDKNPLILTQFNALFDPTVFKSKIQVFLNELEDTADTYCQHEYIEDLIDTDYDRCQRVVYCQLCELTKK
jgi:hypothetical protein